MVRNFAVRDILYLWAMEAAARQQHGDMAGTAEAENIIALWSKRDMDAPFLAYFPAPQKIAAAELVQSELIAKHGEPPLQYPAEFVQWCRALRPDSPGES